MCTCTSSVEWIVKELLQTFFLLHKCLVPSLHLFLSSSLPLLIPSLLIPSLLIVSLLSLLPVSPSLLLSRSLCITLTILQIKRYIMGIEKAQELMDLRSMRKMLKVSSALKIDAMLWYAMICYVMIWYDMMRYDMMWYDILRPQNKMIVFLSQNLSADGGLHTGKVHKNRKLWAHPHIFHFSGDFPCRIVLKVLLSYPTQWRVSGEIRSFYSAGVLL